MYYSQNPPGQDEWVHSIVGNQTLGTFLDVGCSDWREINNTLFFERNYEWRGIGIDVDDAHRAGWIQNRQSRFLCCDATTLDYATLNLPPIVDYLSVDLEPPTLSLVALERILASGLRFRLITYETDAYREPTTREPSRRMLTEAGYTLAKEGKQDDFYTHPELL